MATHDLQNFALLLAGGTGTRLWPVSRELYPKQLVSFIGKDSLLKSTIKRLFPIFPADNVRVVCGNDHFHEIARHMEETGVKSLDKIFCEPCGRNTAPAILLGVMHVLKKEKDAVICVFPADHIIKDLNDFHKKVQDALVLARKGFIVTFGIRPSYPETGYGYIECEKKIDSEEMSEKSLKIKQFVEKPDARTAKTYINSGNFFWNSGMFAFKASVIVEEFKRLQPELISKMIQIFSSEAEIEKEYENLSDISIDYAIMEHTDKGVVLPVDFGWSDIGSWKSLYDFLPKNRCNNVIDGDVVAKNTKNCLILGYKRLIAANHLDNMVVVETPDSVFVSDMDNSREVKSIVSELKKDGRTEYHKHTTVFYSWGTYTLLEKNSSCNTARLYIYPEATYNKKTYPLTINHFVIIKGAADIKDKDNDIIKRLGSGDSFAVSQSGNICIENKGDGPLSIVEVTVSL